MRARTPSGRGGGDGDSDGVRRGRCARSDGRIRGVSGVWVRGEPSSSSSSSTVQESVHLTCGFSVAVKATSVHARGPTNDLFGVCIRARITRMFCVGQCVCVRVCEHGSCGRMPTRGRGRDVIVEELRVGSMLALQCGRFRAWKCGMSCLQSHNRAAEVRTNGTTYWLDAKTAL